MNTNRVSPRLCAFSAAAGLLLGIMGCGSSYMANNATTPSGSSAPAVLTVTDAPLANILSAQVTISSVSLTPGTGTPVTLLTTPTTVELSGLNGIQEPLDIASVPMGTYTAITATISSVSVTYVGSTGQTITASAMLANPTVSIPLNPALTVNSTAGIDLHLAYNLASAFSISGNTVTFTPVVTAACGNIDGESNGQREIEVSGSLVSISPTSLVVQSADSGRQFTFTVASSTQFPSGVNSGNIPIGSIVRVQAQTQPDGSLLALSVTLESGQAGQSDGMQNDGGKGIITAVTAPGGVLSGFTFVPREGFGTVQANATLTALVASSTIYALPVDAAAVGVPADAFTAAELFPGQSVSVAGTFAASSSTSSPTVDAMRITLAGEGTQGILTSMPQGSASNLSFTLTLPTTSFLTTYAGVTALHVLTSPATSLGDNLTASALAAEPAGTNLEVHGYLIMTAPGSFVLYADEVNAVQTSSSDH